MPGLFDVPELVPLAGARRCEAGLYAAVAAGETDKTLDARDGALVGAALVAARALDAADTAGGPKSAYAVAALLTAYRETLHALRLPAALSPSDVPGPTGAGSTPQWARDLLGTAAPE